ncbi:hypothetical protein EP7_000133 [Isosphaeraceae bacterium EP7]
MTTLLQRLRRKSGRVGAGSESNVGPSVREICLIGSASPVGEPGQQIVRQGRGYSVAATQARAGGSAYYSHVGPAG